MQRSFDDRGNRFQKSYAGYDRQFGPPQTYEPRFYKREEVYEHNAYEPRVIELRASEPRLALKEEQRVPEKSHKTTSQDDKCYKCGKPGHYTANCKSPPIRDASFYKQKAEYYAQKSLMAEQEKLISDDPTDDEGVGLAMFCGMAEVNKPESDDSK